jgi:methylphosphotriester-DNA--protein-cysteine methyltransferase
MLSVPTSAAYPRRVRVDALRVVRAAEAVARNRGGASLSLLDLCEAAGVGHTWLHRSFREVYGVSPSHAIRLWRMMTARNRFLDPHTPPVSVKDVAISLGFMSSGRFAAAYYGLFAEYPSETLQRVGRQAPSNASEAV